MNKLSAAIVSALLFAGIGLSATAVVAADEKPARMGTWRLNNWTPADGVQLTLSYRKGTSRWEWGSGQSLADLHGLTSDQLHATHAAVAFTLTRDAGTFTFEGTVLLGIGRGGYQFVPDPTYSAKLSALGYGPVGDDAITIMLMAVRDVSLDYAAEVKYSLKDVQLSDLARLQDHGVSLDFIRAVTLAGYANLTAEEVVRFRDHGIDEAFLRGLKTSGAPDLSADEIIKLHDHGVRPDYVARIHSAGYGDLTVDQIIKLHDHGVD
jgi:hypothetical protein